VPSLGGGNMSVESPDIDWELGAKTGLAATLIPLAGGDICGNMGLAGNAMILYAEKVILDHELCFMAYDLLHEFVFDEADLALEVIKAVGPRGHFLGQKHTRKHIRDFRISPVLRKGPGGSRRDPREIALGEFKRLNEEYYPQPLPEAVQTEFNRILLAADRVAEGLR
jgi:trimethylamine--corrinoid protein Co-methyltransferase